MKDFDIDNIRDIEIRLLPGQVDLVLRSLELYAFNLHHTWSVSVDDDLTELRNALIFYTYNRLLDQRKDSNYRVGYDILKEHKLISHRKKIAEFKNAKKNCINFKKTIATCFSLLYY